ncbi:hypothetical protein diail_6614 [Diaporthe ilicicola]|nr:hypothetical protein diail_6614 [Diaporthe ilicicola]
MLSTTFPSLASPGSGGGDHAGPSIPLEDLDPNTNPAEGHDSFELLGASTSDKGRPAIPVNELRKAIQGIENVPAGLPSKIHDFVATDNGVVGGAEATIPDQWQQTKSSALKITDKSEAILGLFCPCITYEFGGGILASKQTEAIRLFYNVTAAPHSKALEVVVHNAANLRNLAEVRTREEIRKRLQQGERERAEQYVSQLPMEMKKILPDKTPPFELPQVLDDAHKDGKPGIISVIDRCKKIFTGKASSLPAEAPQVELSKTLSPFQAAESGTATQEGQTVEHELNAQPDQLISNAVRTDVPHGLTKDEEGRRSPLTVIERIKLKHDEQAKKPKTKSGKGSKKNQKGKGKQVDTEPVAPAIAKPDDEADKAAQEAEHVEETGPEVRLGRRESIVEIPANARVHSLSEDTFLITKPSQLLHSLDLDTIVPLANARLSHVLEHDQIIHSTPALQEHRLSADAMIPTTAAAPGHFLEGDPVMSGPQQIFSHELLDDPVVERAKASLPHTLELDKKVAATKISKAHDLASDTILPALPKAAAHDLDHDALIAAGAVSVVQEHDLSRDVRILSPSGRVRATHTIDADEVIKETALFRKSPRPNAAAMPGNWASSSTSDEAAENNGSKSNKDNLVASLDAVVNAADQALDELGRPTSSGKENKAADAPSSRGFWGRILFPKRQAAPASVSAAPGGEPAAAKVEENTEGQVQT